MATDDLNPIDLFLLYVDRLQDGKRESVAFTVSSDFLDIEEPELSYTGKVAVTSEAYLAGHELVMDLTVEAQAIIPCAICNSPLQIPVVVSHLYHVVPLTEIKGGVYNFQDAVREAVILESPRYGECGGDCPGRKELARYLHQEKPSKDEEGTFPFANL